MKGRGEAGRQGERSKNAHSGCFTCSTHTFTFNRRVVFDNAVTLQSSAASVNTVQLVTTLGIVNFCRVTYDCQILPGGFMAKSSSRSRQLIRPPRPVLNLRSLRMSICAGCGLPTSRGQPGWTEVARNETNYTSAKDSEHY